MVVVPLRRVVRPFVHPIVAESEEQKGVRSAQFVRKGVDQAGIRGDPTQVDIPVPGVIFPVSEGYSRLGIIWV